MLEQIWWDYVYENAKFTIYYETTLKYNPLNGVYCQESCNLFGWHLVVFLSETSRIQISTSLILDGCNYQINQYI